MNKRGRGLLAVVVGLLLVVLSQPAQANPPDRAQQSEHDRIVSFWTNERVAKAIPRDFDYDPASGRFVPSDRAKPGTGGGTGGVTGASWTKAGTVLKTTGKVLFSMSGTYYVCSASVADDRGTLGTEQALILTAGHCAVDESNGQFAENWMFVPDYDSKPASLTASGSFCAQTVYGCWTASALVVHRGFSEAGGFTNAALPYDFAFAVVDGGGFSGTADLDTLVGEQTISFTSDATAFDRTYAFGYPAAGKYRGKDLVYCAGKAGVDVYTNGATYSLPCNMTGGSSGGPWMTPFDEVTGTGTLVSLNSYGRGGSAVMYGPRLNADAQDLFDAAKTADANTKVP